MLFILFMVVENLVEVFVIMNSIVGEDVFFIVGKDYLLYNYYIFGYGS